MVKEGDYIKVTNLKPTIYGITAMRRGAVHYWQVGLVYGNGDCIARCGDARVFITNDELEAGERKYARDAVYPLGLHVKLEVARPTLAARFLDFIGVRSL